MINPSPRRTNRVPRARSTRSDDSYTVPLATKPLTAHRLTTRAIRAQSTLSETAALPSETSQSTPKTQKIPDHFALPATVPAPFVGTLEASLDAILSWGRQYGGAEWGKDTQCVVNALLKEVDGRTNWLALLQRMARSGSSSDKRDGRGRYLLEELLLLVTRTLLPELILENRGALARLYDRKKQLAIRLTLRYDMAREWRMGEGNHPVTVASLPPPPAYVSAAVPPFPPPYKPALFPNRRPRMRNIMATLIAAPQGGFITHGVRERMKHHVTELDDYLLLTDEEVARWNEVKLMMMTSQIILHWQWLRQSNEVLLDMEVHGWEELEGKADECDWIADDIKKPSLGKKEKGGVGAEKGEV